jgi:alkylation response protein AidB-like acyl-CoA dehydrogenase
MATPALTVHGAPTMETIRLEVHRLAARFAQERQTRQRRRELDQADFEQLAAAGFLLSCLPVAYGGVWESHDRSLRSVCEILRELAHGDSSVALVSAMHPAVLSTGGWLTCPQAAPPFETAWEEQRRWVFWTARHGAWWGTIMSEPGSGGDVSKTKAVARPGAGDGEFRLSGQKHFGSGSGITSYMITSAIPSGESDPDIFFMDMRGVPWDGSAGAKLLAEWDGHGMIATCSHAMAFDDFPATRLAWPRYSQKAAGAPAGGFHGCAFAAVIVGIVEVAMETAREQLARRRTALRAYEQVEWSRTELDAWLIQQAYAGMLRAVEQGPDRRGALFGKVAIAELAESALSRLCKVLGGGSYARQSPFGFWFEDVRALGFLRPPWGLAYDELFQSGWETAP